MGYWIWGVGYGIVHGTVRYATSIVDRGKFNKSCTSPTQELNPPLSKPAHIAVKSFGAKYVLTHQPPAQRHGNGVAAISFHSQFQFAAPLSNVSRFYNPAVIF